MSNTKTAVTTVDGTTQEEKATESDVLQLELQSQNNLETKPTGNEQIAYNTIKLV